MSSAFGVVCESMPLITGVILLALLATPRRASATARHQVLVVAAVLCLTAPLLLRFMPAWQVLPRPNAPVMVAAASAYRQEVVATPAGSTRLESSAAKAPQAAPAPASDAYRNWFRAGAALWLAGVALALLRFACNAAALRRWVRGSVEAPQELQDLLATIQGPPVRLRVVEGEGDAFVYRIFSPVVVLPVSVASQPQDQVRMVLEHELAHVRRRDPLWAWVFEAFRILYWFHPLAWVLVKRSHLAREMAADDLVLLDGRAPEAYAACLGEAALRHRTQAAPPLPALAFVRQHPVLARLHAIMDAKRRRTAPSTGTWLAAGLPIAAPALLLASLGFKAAAEAQPAQRAIQKTTARVTPTPSLWSDLIEPLVTTTPQEPKPAIAAAAPARPPVASPSTNQARPASGSTAPAPRRKLSFTPRGDSAGSPTYTVSLPESSGSHWAQPTPEQSARGFGFRRPVAPTPPTAPSEGPVTPPTEPTPPPSPSPDPSDPKPPVVNPPEGQDPDPGSAPGGDNGSDPGNGGDDGGDPSSENPGEDPDDTPLPSQPSQPEPEPEPSFPTQPQPPVEEPELAPALAIVPCSSEEGSHFAVTWTVPEEEMKKWYPEISADQNIWTSNPDLLAVDGPITEDAGMVRFIAIIRGTMPASEHRFLRLTDAPDFNAWEE